MTLAQTMLMQFPLARMTMSRRLAARPEK